MAHFHELLMILTPDATDTHRTVRANDLSETTIAWVKDLKSATELVTSLERIDLVELYGGFTPHDATAILELTGSGEIPVGMVGVAYPTHPKKIAAIYEAPGSDPTADRWTTGGATMAAAPTAEAAAATAAELVAKGAERVEVCGGMPADAAAAVQAAVNVPVSRILYGFESLPTVAAYRARFEKTLEAHPELLTAKTTVTSN